MHKTNRALQLILHVFYLFVLCIKYVRVFYGSSSMVEKECGMVFGINTQKTIIIRHSTIMLHLLEDTRSSAGLKDALIRLLESNIKKNNRKRERLGPVRTNINTAKKYGE